VHGRQQMFPDDIQKILEIARVTIDRDHRLFFRNHDAKLPKGAITAERVMTTALELISVSLMPVARLP